MIFIFLLRCCLIFFFIAHRYVYLLLWGRGDGAWGPVQWRAWAAFFRILVRIRIINVLTSDDVFCLFWWLHSLITLVLVVNSGVSDDRVEWDKRLCRLCHDCLIRHFLLKLRFIRAACPPFLPIWVLLIFFFDCVHTFYRELIEDLSLSSDVVIVLAHDWNRLCSHIFWLSRPSD